MTKRKQTEQVTEQVTDAGKPYLNRHNGKLQLSDGTIIDAGVSVELSSDQLNLKDVKRLIEDEFLMVK